MPRNSDGLRAIARLEPAAQIVAKSVLEMLEREALVGAEMLSEALRIASLVTGEDAKRLAKLSADRTAQLWAHDIDDALPWLLTWIRLDAERAWSFVEERLAAPPEQARTIMVRVLRLLSDDLSGADGVRGAYLRNPGLLARMIPLIYRHLPVRDDPVHEGVVDWTVEDEAREARSRVAGLLEGIEGAEAHDALLAMSAHPDVAEAQQSFREAERRHAEKVSEPPAWRPAQVVTFASAYEREPENAAELFRLACNRLDGIRYDIEEGDFGDRGIFPNGADEEILQRYFAGRLDRASRRRYSVAREEEVAEHKEPDIRIRHPRAGVVSIEIKPLDSKRYSLESLKSTLKDQLVAQYMRAAGAHFGILLLCKMTKRQWVLQNPRRTIEYPELLGMLNDECRAIMARHSDIKGLTVIGIDATAWEKEKSAKVEGPKADGTANTSIKTRADKSKAAKSTRGKPSGEA